MMNELARAIVCGELMAALVGLPVLVRAQQPVIPVWPGPVPGSENWTQKESELDNLYVGHVVRNVVRPTLTAYLPDRSRANGTAVIVCPGGGFRFLSWQNEGTQVAEWMRDRGVAAFVLKYRLVDTGPTDQDFGKALAALFAGIARITLSKDPGTKLADDMNAGNILALAAEDGRQAVRLLRRRAAEWGVSADRIGIMGFSAGGLVTDEVALHHDAESRPSFAAAIYGAPFGEFSVPADAPPLFILCANDDGLSAAGSARLYSAWKAAGKPAELHIYAKGGHGFGMRKQHLPTDGWIDRLGDWLAVQGLLTPPR